MTMTIEEIVNFATEDTLVSCDFDTENRLATLIKLSSGAHSVRLDEIDYAIPMEWSPDIAYVKWLGSDDVLLWPIRFPLENSSHVGRVGRHGPSVLEVGYPLDVFTDRALVACTYPEEQIIITDELQRQSDFIAVFSTDSMMKIGRFVESFVTDFKNVPFLEVEKGVLDGERDRFWFSAYSTELLWCYEIKKAKAFVCQLGCSPTDILAICSDGDECLVITARSNHVYIRLYVYSNDGIALNREWPFGLDVVGNIGKSTESDDFIYIWVILGAELGARERIERICTELEKYWTVHDIHPVSTNTTVEFVGHGWHASCSRFLEKYERIYLEKAMPALMWVDAALN